MFARFAERNPTEMINFGDPSHGCHAGGATGDRPHAEAARRLTDGRDPASKVRHDMFAIVDRTNMQIFQTANTGGAITANYLAPVPISLAATSGTVPWSNFNWQLQAGTVLTYEPNTDTEETVVVQGNAMAGFTAIFTQNHAAGCTVVSRGNPGPFIQQTYNPANDPLVVLYQTFLN